MQIGELQMKAILFSITVQRVFKVSSCTQEDILSHHNTFIKKHRLNWTNLIKLNPLIAPIHIRTGAIIGFNLNMIVIRPVATHQSYL